MANRTLGRFKEVKLKNDNGKSAFFKDWDGYKVKTVSVKDVEYILCEYCKGKENENRNELLVIK